MQVRLWAELAFLVACGATSLLIRRIVIRERELRRFNQEGFRWWEFLRDDIARFINYRIAMRRERRERGRSEEVAQLVQAGLDSHEAREKFYIIKDLSIIVAVLLCIVAWMHYEEYIAGVFTICVLVAGYWGPTYWVLQKKKERLLQVERELPFFLESLCLGTTIGWEPVKVLSTLTQTLGESYRSHPLVHEMQRAQWLAGTGGTWAQGMLDISARVGHPPVAHALTTVSAALTADQQRHELLQGIASDVQRTYLARLESRTAHLPVLTLGLICTLLVGFALLLQLPFL